MIKYLFKNKIFIIVILFLMIVEPSINSVLNVWLQNIFNSANVNTDKLVLIRMLTIGFMLWIIKRLISFVSSILKNRFVCNTKKDVRNSMFNNILKNSSNSNCSGDYISMFTNDINLLEQRYFDQIISLVSGLFSVAILGGTFLTLNKKLAIPILCFGCLSMILPVFFSKKLNEMNLKYSSQISKFTQSLKEYFTGYLTIKNYAIEENINDKFNEVNKETEEMKFEADYMISLANNVGSLLSWFMQFIAVGLGVMMVCNGEILIGTVIAAQSFASDLASPLQGLLVNMNSIRSMKEIVHKFESVNETLEAESELDVINKDKCDIKFEDLSLMIADHQIIDHFSYTFESGKKYLIVGVNGSGKSSIFKVLKKYMRNCTGDIYINDIHLRDLGSKVLSKIVSYMNEMVNLFSGTVKENITLFNEVDEDQLKKVVRDAHIDFDLNKKVFDGGLNFSSGQQRKIEIARSLLKSVKVLIFDEVVSTLDIETAYYIEKMVLGFKDKTVIFISHNFSGKLIREYDDILVMDQGRLLAHGKFDELYETCDYFKKICDIKFL